MKINILGTEYQIKHTDEGEDPKLRECDGYIDTSIKEIVIAKFEQDAMSVRDLEVYEKQVLRHEIIHGFLFESGLWGNSGTVDHWGHSEEITDWIALQFPKMLKVFQEAKAV